MSKEQNEFKTSIEKLRESSSCKHCKNNPKGSTPFVEMKTLPMTSLAEKALDQVVKQFNVSENCFVCLALETFSKMPLNKQLEWLKERA
jgi:hypothetical protein